MTTPAHSFESESSVAPGSPCPGSTKRQPRFARADVGRLASRRGLFVPAWRASVGVSTGLVLAAAASATDGYFSDGYGIKAKGRAGVALTETDDAFGGANNPAAAAWAGDRLDFGVDLFFPKREAARTGPATPLNAEVRSGRSTFAIPELAYAQTLNEQWSFGVAIYGNGGMNTDYPGGQLNLGPGASNQNLLAGSGNLGVDFSQLFIAPTIAWKFNDHQSVGLSPVLGYQRFKAYGLDAFSQLSQDPTALTDRNVDESIGAGVRVGYLWNITEAVSLGAVYTSPVFMQEFERYRGLFAGDGSFDTPQSFGIGLGWQALPPLRLGLDYKWIDYAGIAPVGNPSTQPGLLGQSDGPGFGWQSISVVKVGADWKLNDQWVFRTGYSFNENPVTSRDVTFNILAPGVVQHHVSAGVTFSFGRSEITAAYVHAFENSVEGESRFVALGLAPAGTRERITMSQDSVALQYSFKF